MKYNTRSLLLTALFAALTAIGAWIQFPLGITSVTLQFFFTAMAGILLGPVYGAISQAVYVLLGLSGLPVFTQGGGLGYIVQPSFGFLLGLIPAAFLIGLLTGRRSGTVGSVETVLACTAGLAVLYLVGLPYMYLIVNVYLGKGLPLTAVLQGGMLIYLPGDILKIAATALLAPVLTRNLAAYRA
ncbi:MAG: biotin transporter BioY [Oscillospiraceae bacterium]|nr:biotin transporter BioY [Oscillospiraceae bacterium]